MRIAYLILAHMNPPQLVELVTALDHPEKTVFYIHVDKKNTDFLDDPSIKSIIDKDNVSFLENRVRVYWGGFSIVEATLRLLRKAIDEGGFQYAVLLSGQDFPVKSNRFIESFFQAHDGKEFISYAPLSPQKMERIEYYWSVDGVRHLLEATGSKKLQRWGWSAYSRLTRLVYRHVPGLKRKFLPGFAPYGGPQWFAISSRCATYILRYLEAHPEYCEHFRCTVVPDEIFFQTLILNSPFRDHVVDDALRFIEWEVGASSPRVLTSEDFARIVASDRLYARKFDSSKYPDVLRKIRRHIIVQA